MRNKFLWRRGDVADVMKLGNVRLTKLGETVDDMCAQIGGRLEIVNDVLCLDTVFKMRQPLCVLPFVYVFDSEVAERVLLINDEYQARDLALDSTVVFHLSNGNSIRIVSFGNVSV